jgi:hypothetical protein
MLDERLAFGPMYCLSHPWINTTIRRRICQKQRAHKKARKTKKKKDMNRYKRHGSGLHHSLNAG